MTLKRITKILIFVAAALLLFTAAALVGYRALTRTVHTRLLAALGPDATVDGIEIALRDVTLKNLRVHRKGERDPLTVERIVVTPSLRSLPTGQIRLSSVELEGLAMVITVQPNGRVPLPLGLPPPQTGTAKGTQTTQVAISQVEVQNGRIDLIDRTVPGAPVQLRLEKVRASIHELAVPLTPVKSPLEFEAVIHGKEGDGRVRLSGWVEPIARDASVKATLRSIDLTLLTSYLLTVEDAAVDRGRLDMDLDFQVRHGKVNAPGKAALSDLQLRSGPGLVNSFMGASREAVLDLLKSRNGKIDLAFRVEGDLSDPRFQLQRSFAEAMTAGLAEQLGVSVKSVGSGVVGLGKKSAEALGGTAQQLGGGLKRLFEKQR